MHGIFSTCRGYEWVLSQPPGSLQTFTSSYVITPMASSAAAAAAEGAWDCGFDEHPLPRESLQVYFHPIASCGILMGFICVRVALGEAEIQMKEVIKALFFPHSREKTIDSCWRSQEKATVDLYSRNTTQNWRCSVASLLIVLSGCDSANCYRTYKASLCPNDLICLPLPLSTQLVLEFLLNSFVQNPLLWPISVISLSPSLSPGLQKVGYNWSGLLWAAVHRQQRREPVAESEKSNLPADG